MLPVNTSIWIPDPQAGFVEALVLEAFEPGHEGRVLLVKTKAEIVLPPAASKLIERRVESSKDSDNAPDDLSSLIHLSRASLLDALRRRLETNKVYTSVGPILVAVNPYCTIPELYTEAKRKGYFELTETEPHIYETAARAFMGATKNRKDQSIISSGESGAGKTYTTKLLTDFFVYASSRSDNRSDERALVQQRLQSALPMIEAFGNAKTSRNDNSSRFGCWTEIAFSNNEICGASVTGFNLEKSRVCAAGRGASVDLKSQRNFHVFYQIVAAQNKLHGREFRYLGEGMAKEKFTVQDRAHFDLTSKAMDALGLSGMTEQIFNTVEGVLELGNVEFEALDDVVTKEETSVLKNRDVLERACELLGGLDADEVERGFLQRDMSNPKETIWRAHSKAQAEEARDAMAKHIYGRLFDWLLVRVNEATARTTSSSSHSASKGEPFTNGSSSTQGSIGLLDTYGFEIFTTNSFEQLCINYCNEKIMSAFNETCIRAEHDLYKQEGLVMKQQEWTASEQERDAFLLKSKVCLDLFEHIPHGVFSLLDDEIKVPKGNDQGYLRKLRDAQKGHAHLVPYVSTLKDSKAKHLFGIVHFAGTVHYSVEDFVEKNRDTLLAQLDVACSSHPSSFVSTQLFAPQLFSLSSSPKKTPSKRKSMARAATTKATLASQKTSLSTRFRSQLDDLMTKIASTETHFVRCIKPNGSSAAREFDGVMVLEQLNYGGVLETCRLRKDGFQVRRSLDDFVSTYSVLMGASAKPRSADQLARELAERYGLECAVGRTTAFLRAEDFAKLEHALLDRSNNARVKVQSFARLVLEKRKHSQRREYVQTLEKAVRDLDEQKICKLLQEGDKLFKHAQHVPAIKQAREILRKLETEREIVQVLNAAIESKSIPALEKAIQRADKLDHDLEKKVGNSLSNARSLLDKLVKESARKEKVDKEESRVARSASALVTIQRAVKRVLFRKSVKVAFQGLRDAVSAKDVDACMKWVRRLSDLGLRAHPEVQSAARMLPERRKKTKQTAQALSALNEAVKVARFKSQKIKYLAPGDVAPLTCAINVARVEGCEDAEMQDAIELERDMFAAVAANSTKSKWWQMCCCAPTSAVASAARADAAVNKPKKYI